MQGRGIEHSTGCPQQDDIQLLQATDIGFNAERGDVVFVAAEIYERTQLAFHKNRAMTHSIKNYTVNPPKI
jgi:hypothetical protein